MATYNAPAPTDTELAYAAGIIDGEGTISAYRQKSPLGHFRYYIKVHFDMIEDDIPLWFQLKFGGKFSPNQNRATSTARQHWGINCRKAAQFLEHIVPYLRLKKNRAELAIQLANAARKPGQNTERRVSGKRIASLPLSLEEQTTREGLALQIRRENLLSNKGASSTAKWGVN